MPSATTIRRDRSRRSNTLLSSSYHFLLLALVSLVLFWGVGFYLLVAGSFFHQDFAGGVDHWTKNNNVPTSHAEHVMTPRLLSRGNTTTFVKSVRADVRGNLGPVDVIVQGGNDWLKDRWQAASNMHGKNIPGKHWIVLEFTEPIVVSKMVLDWETAYCKDYVVEGSMEAIVDGEKDRDNNIHTLFDGREPKDQAVRSERKFGQSPGVEQKMPLHIVHTIPNNPQRSKPVKYLRLKILKSVTGWGVSLWQWDVYGFLEREVIM